MTRRQAARVRSATGAVIEALEERRVLSVSIALGEDGVLRITGNDERDGVNVGTGPDWEPGTLLVSVNGVVQYLPAAGVKAIQIDLGGGNDGFDFNNLGDRGIELPIVIDGGAGDDELYGQRDRNGHDQLIDPSAWLVTLRGGAGNDLLYAGSGSEHEEGGPGDDVLIRQDNRNVIDGGDGYDTFYEDIALIYRESPPVEAPDDTPVPDTTSNEEEPFRDARGNPTSQEADVAPVTVVSKVQASSPVWSSIFGGAPVHGSVLREREVDLLA